MPRRITGFESKTGVLYNSNGAPFFCSITTSRISKTRVQDVFNISATRRSIVTRGISVARGRDYPNVALIICCMVARFVSKTRVLYSCNVAAISSRITSIISKAAIGYLPNKTTIGSRIKTSIRSVTPVNYHSNIGIITSVVPKTTHVVFTNFAREITTRSYSDTARSFTGLIASSAIEIFNQSPETCRSKTPAEAGGALLVTE